MVGTRGPPMAFMYAMFGTEVIVAPGPMTVTDEALIAAIHRIVKTCKLRPHDSYSPLIARCEVLFCDSFCKLVSVGVGPHHFE